MKRFILRKENPNVSAVKFNARDYIDDLDSKRSWAIEIKEYRKKRSLDQNRYIHAVPFPIMMEHTGYTLDELKRELCGLFMGTEKYEIFGEERERPIKTTSQMTTKEMTDFIEWLQWFGSSRLNLRIPSPNEWVE